MKRIRNFIYFLALTTTLGACSTVSAPSKYESSDMNATIFPDYTDVTVPSNIAPLNFMMRDAEKLVAQFSWTGGSKSFGKDNTVLIPLKEWKRMLAQAKGDAICVTVYSKCDGLWTRWKDFNINVAEEPVDKYLSYRMIEPSYVAYEEMVINQRDLESFEEKTFFSTVPGIRKGVDQCINCHSYQNYRTDNMLFHIRGQQGGTMMIRNGEAELLTKLKKEGMISNPVYPAWHPTDNVIAFSTNSTRQSFHTHDNDKVEVQDFKSQLVIYDLDNDRMIPVQSDSLDMENFPTWSPDGTKLYFTSARYCQQDMGLSFDKDITINYKDVHYSIYVRDYDRGSKTLGPRRTVLELPEESASLPRVSPDGRKLLFAHGKYGCFHIWHNDADIYLIDLETGTIDPLTQANGKGPDSYPSWSSNGKWIVMASRRDDGNYSRVYMAYFGSDGKVRKAFELPQKDPSFYDSLLKSYNRPELTINELPEIQ